MENNIESNFVPYNIALELKELGFDEPCLAYLKPNVLTYEITIGEFNEFEYHSAPTFSQAFHFFRNKYGLMHIINPYDFTAEINYLNKRVVDDVYGDFIPHDHLVDDEGEEIKHLSYEEAEIACLLELINICKK
jgi:hypothetical protein